MTRDGGEEFNALNVGELEELLGIRGIDPEHIVAINRLARAWKLQADIGGLNQETIGSVLHAVSVRATVLMPSLGLKATDPHQFAILNGLSQLARAEEAIIEWAFKDKFTIDGTARDVSNQITPEK